MHDRGLNRTRIPVPTERRTHITLATRELPRGPRGERRYFGHLQGQNWGVSVHLTVGQRIETYPLLLGTFRTLTLIGSLNGDQYTRLARYLEGVARGEATLAGNAWDSYNKVLEHPGTATVLSALSAIPGAGQFTSTAYLAAKAVGAIGRDLTAAKKKRKKSGYTAKKVAKAANQALAKSGREVRLTPEDIERAVRAYFASRTPQGRKRVRVLQAQPVSPDSESYRELLALQFAQEEGPAIELTPDSLDPLPEHASIDVAGGEAPCRCHVWSDTSGPLDDIGGFEDSILAGPDEFLSGPGDRPEDLVDIPDLAGLAGPEDADTDLSALAGPSEGLGGPEELDTDLSTLAGPSEGLGGPEETETDLSALAGPTEGLAGPEELDTDLSALAGPSEGLAGPEDAEMDLSTLAGPMEGLGGPEEPEPDLSTVAGPEELEADLSTLAGPVEGLGGPEDTEADLSTLAGAMEGLGGPEEHESDLSTVAGPMEGLGGPEDADTDLSTLAGPMEGLGGPEEPEPDLSTVAGPMEGLGGPEDAEADLSTLAGPMDELGEGLGAPFDLPPGQFAAPTFDAWTYTPFR